MSLPKNISWNSISSMSLDEKKASLELLEKSLISKTSDGQAMIARLKADIANAG